MNPYSTLTMTNHCPKDEVHLSKRGSFTALGYGDVAEELCLCGRATSALGLTSSFDRSKYKRVIAQNF